MQRELSDFTVGVLNSGPPNQCQHPFANNDRKIRGKISETGGLHITSDHRTTKRRVVFAVSSGVVSTKPLSTSR